MAFGWMKRVLPRGLYGRAALILIVPVVSLQLVVSAAFLQRHFENVTQQLTAGLALDLRYVLTRLEQDGEEAAMTTAAALQITLTEGQSVSGETVRPFYDFSGREVIAILNRDIPETRYVDLAARHRVVIVGLETANGVYEVALQRRRVSASNPHQLLVLMVFTGLLMTGIAYFFLRNQLRPIRRLAKAADAFGKGRIVEYTPRGALEVRSAGRAFLDMRNRIEQQIEQRTMMLSGVSHDLRTPLTRMKLGLSLQEKTSDIEALEQDVEEMQALLTTFLDFARADALDDPVPTDPKALAERIVEDAARGGGEAELLAPEAVPLVDIRPQAVRRALGNLVSNAMRYGRRARVTLHVLDHAVRYTVEDDGPGIAPEDRAEALQPFVRLDAARNQDRGTGVGLGLAIANDIARSHGGTLRLSRSDALGGLRVDLVLAR
ncbi:HAMP domain-containing protein [Roseobacter sp. HKCCD9010]|uniref:ATP-binding protein n=2 Tax=unclassified Roseobacter TaxID=196798 RepID=UPI001491CAFC|nr:MULTISPECIES: ATP-binding protein [unclassified Roseobacter]MBF9050772.1 HAMP domain-containing protein [Rhodobacterales bacterium HKCCD4356]NNV11810.1 HAMP domain-containing protein [Roseobacter sp. HKCCD7357]NNV17961.1 HAMP domain-containing protein [Roseobacter sp. HKCCD8768]NNV26052.1 HAMP domain-containing protein [Roseobacter sp. HKCCD8192]NNV31688.1 HAMP domain-containing protein [Roseobacter sp. HKCCD9061]NNV35776.1 HAMP domain-containing protein [Roseobacter sp. HKCCD9073]NNV4430